LAKSVVSKKEDGMKILFEENAKKSEKIEKLVSRFFKKVPTLENKLDVPMVIFQDGVNNSYYIKCQVLARIASKIIDLNAKIKAKDPESFRANRELMLKDTTYLKMELDAANGREFNDIIVEYNSEYNADKPLKVWGGQHRAHAISGAINSANRYHGFKVYFDLNEKQRTEVALISNTNMGVSDDTFDRMLEETTFGNTLRKWCQKIGFLGPKEDFPDVGSRSEKITVKLARSFIVNYYMGLDKGKTIKSEELDKNIYDPYVTETGVSIDSKYAEIMSEKRNKILSDKSLIEAGEKFLELHRTQYEAVKGNPKIRNRKAYRNKALVISVLCGWSYIAGLLQNHRARLLNHYMIPKTTSKIPDPLNAEEMSNFKHDSDLPTYRGLGTRQSAKDMQRLAQVFLAKSLSDTCTLDKQFLQKAVSTVVGLTTLKRGYV
jgi:hypothetical protein